MAEPKMSGTIPPPRDGLIGAWDRFVGPGASGWENAGTLGLAAVGAVAPPSGYAWLPSVLGFKLLLGHGTPRGPLSALRRRRRPVDG